MLPHVHSHRGSSLLQDVRFQPVSPWEYMMEMSPYLGLRMVRRPLDSCRADRQAQGNGCGRTLPSPAHEKKAPGPHLFPW